MSAGPESTDNPQFMYAPYVLEYGPDVGTTIDLISPELLPLLPEGTVLINVMGRKAIVGEDEIAGDTRKGMLGYGLPSQSEDGLTYLAPFRSE